MILKIDETAPFKSLNLQFFTSFRGHCESLSAVTCLMINRTTFCNYTSSDNTTFIFLLIVFFLIYSLLVLRLFIPTMPFMHVSKETILVFLISRKLHIDGAITSDLHVGFVPVSADIDFHVFCH